MIQKRVQLMQGSIASPQKPPRSARHELLEVMEESDIKLVETGKTR